jgi:hypothetical protein
MTPTPTSTPTPIPDAERIESPRDVDRAIHSETVLAGDGWIHELGRRQVLRIVDVEGNQAADTLFFDAADHADRYSAVDTIRHQRALYLSTGSHLMSTRGNALLEIVADTCGRHDTLGGACSRESNTMRYSLDKHHMHACRDTFTLLAARWPGELSKRDITHNINFFMNVPVTPEGGLRFEDGVSAPGRYVELRALRPVLVLISNCPQLNNPCNAYDPTPIRVHVWDE